ncbi:conserved Plasmodium protein, unknown function [Plasmodium knowlesi strain H]|uniref:Uncharacterized protein n=3 Tax=Plasmodium knowlesi TaxID=5850 RepID=A0A5K1U4B4_PLAKH|nr:conserved Plasmodium protein, unknown function [Plasmodium knowlesi strain H]OTN66817.1 Uncharacterized protein PKNOH_S08497500 [Plasmodium knowlesi]CAA9986756.1 conserved Plasmodium protein, unknown function [Plasmodium knowlesi strain H]SBO23584.1 conserved Plasmodium protein, unknown function [Plasmodium knowlesi strain H]SBO25129.1 conserved Plasmodium protein, unknown function [Plasmodium knowlesi strain H]VVS76230.1 conserved Plasmodium protein, unknown function [Plasmodium knowlesi s|eukprot:XP_002257940.1 hypothetical protein, conserved in Plasmodium species [Plasmodium knowlesi strain H]
MNLSITIRGGLAGSSSGTSQSGSKKYGSNVLNKRKQKKDIPEKKKGKIVAKKSKNLSPKIASSISVLPSDRKNNLHVLERVLSEVGNGNSHHQGWRKYAHKFGLLGRLVSKGHTGSASSGGTKHGGSLKGTAHSGSNSQRSGKKSTHPIHTGSKLVKQDAKGNIQEEKKKSHLNNLQKNTPPKKNKNIYSSNLNTPTASTGGKKSYKLSKLLIPLEKFGKKKKNRASRNFLGLKKGVNMAKGASGKAEGETSQNGDTQNELPVEKTGSGSNHQEGDSTDAAKQSVTESSSLGKGAEMDSAQVAHLIGKSPEDQEDPSRETPFERVTQEPIDPYFTEGEYDPSKDILREQTCFYDAGKVSASLLPGYKEVSFEGIGETEGNNTSPTESRRAQRNVMYLPNRFYSHHNFNPVRSKGGQDAAYYINGLSTLDGCLFTSVDISQGTIHKQYNIGVTYPYGVPFVDLKQRGRKLRR